MSRPLSRNDRIDRIGMAQGVGAYFAWGVLPLYFLLLKHVGAGEVVADRVIWSLALLVIVVFAVRRGPALKAAFTSARTMGLLAISAALISVNWLTYIWAVQQHHVLAASLGYFLNPLLNVLLGVLVFRERLTRMQTAAVGLAAAGVAVLAVGAGGGLWISLMLAGTFAIYGLVRKIAPVEALEGLTIETVLLAPLALGYTLWLGVQGTLVFGTDAATTALLIASGVLTAVPLLLFSASARRLPYSTLGLLQYLAPTLQFLIAVTISGEVMTVSHMICFALIWSGLALYITSSLRMPRPAPPE